MTGEKMVRLPGVLFEGVRSRAAWMDRQSRMVRTMAEVLFSCHDAVCFAVLEGIRERLGVGQENAEQETIDTTGRITD